MWKLGKTVSKANVAEEEFGGWQHPRTSFNALQSGLGTKSRKLHKTASHEGEAVQRRGLPSRSPKEYTIVSIKFLPLRNWFRIQEFDGSFIHKEGQCR